MSEDETAPRLLIVGGGLTGAALATHAVRAGTCPLAIAIVEPAAGLGRGAAYGTTDPAHRINVPSHRMSLLSDDSGHLTRWLEHCGLLPDASSTDVRGDHYVARAAYGAYVADTMDATVAAAGPRVAFRHHRARVVSIARGGGGWQVRLDDGQTLHADGVALCPGHPAPALPCPVSETARSHPGFVPDPWRRDAFAAIGSDDTVLVVGTGLSMLDVLASLKRAGHRGSVLAVSRRGLLARPQGGFRDGYDPFADAPLPRTAHDLLRILRDGLDRFAPEAGWQEIVDAFRFRLQRLWTALPPEQQRRVVRRLLPFWEVHRFRAAPQPHALAAAWRHDGRLRIARAGLTDLDAEDGRLVATLGRASGEMERHAFDAVVLCTGPGRALCCDPLVGDLLARELACPDGIGVGLAVDAESRLARPAGGWHDTLWAFGPVTRGSFGEMTGAPDIVRHLARIAPGLCEALADSCAARIGGERRSA